MADNPPTSPLENPEGEKQDNLQAEQEVAQQQKQALSQELPEGQQTQILFQLAAGLLFYKTRNYVGLKNAFLAVTDPNLAENLLDLAHPEKCMITRAALRVTEKELGKKSVADQGFAQAKFLFWKSPKLTPEEQQRAVYATVLARRLHRKVNNRTNDLKIQAYLTRYSLELTSLPQLKSNISEWLKKNPGRSVDDALIVEARRLQRERGSKLTRKEEKEARKELAGCNGKAIEEFEKNGAIGRAKDVINKQILDPNQLLPTRELIRSNDSYIYEGIIPQKGPITEAALAGGFAESAFELDAFEDLRTPAEKGQSAALVSTGVVPAAGQPAGAAPSPAGGVALPNVFSNFFSGLSEKFHLPVGVSNFLGRLGGRLDGALGRVNIAMNAAKTAINTGLNAFAPGLGTAVGKINDVLKAITGIDVEAAAIKLGIIVLIGIPVAIAFLPLFLNSSNALPYYGSKNAREVAMSNNSLSWYEFEEKFLSVAKQKTSGQAQKAYSWQQFEKENLTPLNIYLSLDKK